MKRMRRERVRCARAWEKADHGRGNKNANDWTKVRAWLVPSTELPERKGRKNERR